MNMSDSYQPPIVTIDSVVFQLVNNQLSVLLIQRAAEPFKGKWALPGGYTAAGETTADAMRRILHAKAGVSTKELPFIEQLYTFDTVAGDPRGHAVSVSYLALGRDIKLHLTKSTQHPQFFPINGLPEIAYNHDEIIAYAHQRLSGKITYTNAVFALLPELFTLTQLQMSYEAILGRELDKRNFRKKFLSLELIEPTTQHHQEGAHRPALLYTFAQQQLQTLSRSFD